MSSRDDDLDWLYGRDTPSRSAPEPTQVMPGSFGPSGGSAGGPIPPMTPAPPGARPPGQPVPGQSVPGQSVPGPEQSAPFDTSAYGAVPAYGQGSSRPQAYQDWRQAGGTPGSPGQPPAPTGKRSKPPRRRHPVRNVFLILILLVLATATWLVAVPLHAWSQVQRVDDTPSGQRPATQPGTTYLLVGSDSREGLSKAERKKLGTGSSAGQRTDTMMIMYIPTSGKPALISIPRDSYVPIPGNGKNKINAAYAFGGPKLLVKTVEQNTGLRVDAYMEIGFGGFVNIIDALGGIDMCIPKAIKDTDSHLNLKKGCQNLDGTTALGYVRMRKADPLGDLGRVQRQRQMLAAIAKKSATPLTVFNPVRYWTLTHAVADSISVGEDTSLLETTSMALAMRKVANDEGYTLTVPVSNPGASTPAGSAVLWDTAEAQAMFKALASGDTSGMDKYAK
jgi:LCP family protein required for cell wall assembly